MSDTSELPLAPRAPVSAGATAALRLASGGQLATWLLALFVSQRLWPEGQSGIFWGGLVMAGNLQAMRYSARGLASLSGEQGASSPRVARHLALAFGGKFIAMLVATALIIEYAQPHPLGFFAGFATLLVGIVCLALPGATGTKG